MTVAISIVLFEYRRKKSFATDDTDWHGWESAKFQLLLTKESIFKLTNPSHSLTFPVSTLTFELNGLPDPRRKETT